MRGVFVTKFGGSGVLACQHTDMPSPGPTEVLIRVAAASVNFADIKARYGKYHGAKTPPYIPGLDVAGTIEAVGGEVTQFQVGQRVIAFPNRGSYAEYTTADQVLTYAIPDALDMETAAACPIVSFTSYNMLHKAAALQAGETVLIHAAAGGVGTTAIQLAKILGARQVIGTVGSEAKADAAYQAGADFVIAGDRADFAAKVQELTDGKGVDVILDSIGGQVLENSLSCLAMFGRLVQFGNAGGGAGGISWGSLSPGCRSILGYSLGTYRRERPEALRQSGEEVIALLASGRLRMIIDRTFSLEEAAQAQDWVEQRRSRGKVLLIP
ncbi:zinc-binding alcohol dehydrogenase family protein [Brevibacillus sp. B_LB10_24]|uniref:quinone oxidoreductase family protein n=1 Tax=Brevibacillus sp. B_LB10_24 TaxID=3380645 RepID=UPI0038BBC9B2